MCITTRGNALMFCLKGFPLIFILNLKIKMEGDLNYTLTKKALPQNPEIEVWIPNYKEPLFPVNHGGFGWYGTQSYNSPDLERAKLMCNECGVCFDWLSRHVSSHGLSPRQYKIKYSLLLKSPMASKIISEKRRTTIKNHPEILAKCRHKLMHSSNYLLGKNGISGSRTLEFQNKKETCPGQVLRALSYASEIYGLNITNKQVEEYRPGLVGDIIRRHGSFNEAKRLIRAVVNKQHGEPKYPKAFLLGDMVNFYRKYGYWPTSVDYRVGKLSCSQSPILRNGGWFAMRQEAQALLKEQNAMAEYGTKEIPKIAEKIEMSFAGCAMR